MRKKLMCLLAAMTFAASYGAENITTDVVVVGGGGAGLSAAIAAKEKGANVVLVEKMLMLGGNTNYATAGINAANTKLQKKLGIEDNAELFYNDTMKGGKNVNNPELVKKLTTDSANIIDWLTERGADLSEVVFTCLLYTSDAADEL